MNRKRKIKFPGWVNRQLLLVVFVALFFSTAMTWVELASNVDHQKNVDILRQNSNITTLEDSNVTDENNQNDLLPMSSPRQTDGIVFGSALLLIIIVGGVIVNIRNI